MSVSSSQTLRHSDMQRQLKEHIHNMEKAHKADIQTYSSGHLGPNSLAHRPLYCRPHKPIWNKPKCEDKGQSIEKRSKMETSVDEMTDALHSFTIDAKLQKHRIEERPESPGKELLTPDLTGVQDVAERAKVRKTVQENMCAESETLEQDRAGLTWSYPGHRRMQLLRTKDLTIRKCLSGRETAERHERKLQQALRKLPASGGPCRERLAVFSDVFNDVCDGSPAFGSVLREIKTEYDSYLESLLSSQSSLQNESASASSGVSTDATELKQAASHVFLLKQEARRALEENNRVRIEYEDAQAKALVDQKENESCESVGHEDHNVFSDLNPSELSSFGQLEAKSRQVWKVWNEVQRLQKDIRETMVSTVTTSALKNSIIDTEDEIMNFAASNVFLQRTNKDLEQNISTILGKAKLSEETSLQVWEEIWTTLNG